MRINRKATGQSAAPAAPSAAPNLQYGIEHRWTPELLADGFVPVSVIFLDHYRRLNITYNEAMFIIHLIRYKWTADAPHPSLKSIATQMGISPAMARSHARSLDQKGYVKRVFRTGAANRFLLEPLFNALKQSALLHPRQVRVIDVPTGQEVDLSEFLGSEEMTGGKAQPAPIKRTAKPRHGDATAKKREPGGRLVVKAPAMRQ